MKANMNITDRLLRGLVAIILGTLALSETITGVWALLATVVAVIFLFTSFFGVCPIYSLFRIGTKKKA